MEEESTGSPTKRRMGVGNEIDIRCKANMIKGIGRTTCKNNCKQWKVVGLKPNGKYRAKCVLGY